MKPLHSIEALETRSWIADAPACLTRHLPASQCGAPFPFVPCQPPGKDTAGNNRLMTGTFTNIGYCDAGLATPPERKRRPNANDNIVLETGEMQ
jgi:hypothetical protein